MSDGGGAGTSWFALVDGAADPGIVALAQAARDHACLFSGPLVPALAAASPWLVRVDPQEPLLHAWQDRGRGRCWGILIESALDLAALRALFRRFTQARLPDGQVVMFRFWDPRVLPAYLSAAAAEQRVPWFDGVRQYVVEGAAGTQHSFRLRGGRLFDGDTPVGEA